MRTSPVFLCLFFILGNQTSSSAQTPDSATSAFIVSVREKLFNDQFESADSLCNRFISTQPDKPVGYLFKCGVLLGQMSDSEEPTRGSELRNLIDSTLILCDRGLEVAAASDSGYYYLWRGHAHVYKSLFESRFGSLTAAIKNGFRAHDDYRDGLECDSTMYDLYFGLGNYHYWKSAKAGILRKIGLVSNDIEKGIAELRLACDSGEFFSEAARNSMIWIWLDRKKYDSVIILSNRLIEKYPESRTFRWPLAAAHFKKSEFEKSALQYQILREHFDQNKGNYFNLIECDYQIHECYKKLGLKMKADEILKRIDGYSSDIPSGTKIRQRGRLKYLRRELAR
ncbi:MAG: tetratricopeptide repeat protein [Candidatus Zixiibacteriota bacterium]